MQIFLMFGVVMLSDLVIDSTKSLGNILKYLKNKQAGHALLSAIDVVMYGRRIGRHKLVLGHRISFASEDASLRNSATSSKGKAARDNLMLTDIFFILEILLVLSSLLAIRLKTTDRQFALSLIRSTLALPVLIAQYIYVANDFRPQPIRALLLSETIFSIVWLFTSLRLREAMISTRRYPLYLAGAEFVSGITACVVSLFVPMVEALPGFSNNYRIHLGSYPYLSALLVILSMLLMIWHLEWFWRNLETARRWEFKFLVVANLLICCSLVWAASYRLTYLLLRESHLLLLAAFLTLALFMLLYAIGHHKLLNRKLFISRTIVHASVAPVALGIYLLGLGGIAYISPKLGWSMDYILFWLLVGIGFVSAALYLCSERLRKRVHHFISTHFYVNKYEYRDEWLVLSHLLRGTFSSKEIVHAVGRVLGDSLYERKLIIWAGNEVSGYRIQYPEGRFSWNDPSLFLSGKSSLIRRLKSGRIYYTRETDSDSSSWQLEASDRMLLDRLGVALLSPILAGEQLLGVIGVEDELSGGCYGTDDFDLLAAVGAQAGSALLASYMGEELAALKQNQAIDSISSFVLHDIKNAASMLSLMRQNAENHLGDPDFQQDMLETVDDTLNRMKKVQHHLAQLKALRTPDWTDIELCSYIKNYVRKLSPRLPGLVIYVECEAAVMLRTDPQILSTVLENLMVNALEAGGAGTEITINVCDDYGEFVFVKISDTGPGIPEPLKPTKLFEPFQTTKHQGSGVGLWQVRQFVEGLAGSIELLDSNNAGSCFLIALPLNGELSSRTPRC